MESVVYRFEPVHHTDYTLPYYIILTEIMIIFNSYGVTSTQRATSVLLYSCNKNITLKMATSAAETCW